jgi:hypothetical protein
MVGRARPGAIHGSGAVYRCEPMTMPMERSMERSMGLKKRPKLGEVVLASWREGAR